MLYNDNEKQLNNDTAGYHHAGHPLYRRSNEIECKHTNTRGNKTKRKHAYIRFRCGNFEVLQYALKYRSNFERGIFLSGIILKDSVMGC